MKTSQLTYGIANDLESSKRYLSQAKIKVAGSSKESFSGSNSRNVDPQLAGDHGALQSCFSSKKSVEFPCNSPTNAVS